MNKPPHYEWTLLEDYQLTLVSFHSLEKQEYVHAWMRRLKLSNVSSYIPGTLG